MPSHNIASIITMFSFQGASLSSSISQETQWNRTPLPSAFASRPFVPFQSISLVESTGIEPVTSCLQGRRSPSWANPPYRRNQIHNLRIYLFKLNARLWLCFSSQIKTRFAGLLICSDMTFLKWWAKMDSNHRPHDYQSCALASWAIGPYPYFFLVESTGIEPVTSCLQGRRSPSWANPPFRDSWLFRYIISCTL